MMTPANRSVIAGRFLTGSGPNKHINGAGWNKRSVLGWVQMDLAALELDDREHFEPDGDTTLMT